MGSNLAVVVEPTHTAPERSAPIASPLPPRTLRDRRADRAFAGGMTASGIAVAVVLAAIAAFLVWQAWPAIVAEAGELPHGVESVLHYVWPLLFGSVWAAALALLMVTPIAIAVALFCSHYAPKRLASVAGFGIDLLAAVPSVVFGLWGVTVLAPRVAPVYAWLTEHLGWIPLFKGPVSGTGRTILTAAIVLAVMVLPIMTAMCRELFLTTPVLNQEAALALGATRWEMVRLSVLPAARNGIISAVLLGLARALGETMAVAMVLSPAFVVDVALLTSQNPSTIASNIALQFPEATGVSVNALLASGLALFAVTLVVNLAARLVLSSPNPGRYRERRTSQRRALAGLSKDQSGHQGFTFELRSARARAFRSGLARVALTGGFFTAALPLVSILTVTVVRGMNRFDLDFFSQSMRGVTGPGGGGIHAIVGTLEITGAAIILSVPLGIAVAVFVSEYAGARMSLLVMRVIDMMLGIPSIVAGLFAFALFSLLLSDTGVRSGFIGAVALSVLMIPVVTRASVEFLALVPVELREGALGLGVSRRRTAFKVVLPTAFGGLVTGVVLALARVIGETAPLLLVAGFTASMNYNLFSERMMSLPVYVYTQYAAQGADPAPFLDRAWTGALTLMLIVVALNLSARMLGRFFVRMR